MINLGKKHLLFIEPKGKVWETPVNDNLTRMMNWLLRKKATHGPYFKGWHTCACGVKSANYDLYLPDGTMTNSLAVHYLKHHRSEVPKRELVKLILLVSLIILKEKP